MNNKLSQIQYAILSCLVKNNPKPYALGQITHDIGVYKELPPNLSPRKQNEEIQKHIEYLIGKGLVIKKSTEIKGSLSGHVFIISTKGVELYEKEQTQMNISSGLEKMINDDIERLNSPTIEILEEIKAKYDLYIDAVRDIPISWDSSRHLRDGKKIQSALEAFKAFGCKNNNHHNPSVIIHNENINTNSFQIDISFDQVREDIKGNTYLTEEQIEQIISKIDELEQIDEEGKTKKEKWAKAKSILSWLGDKGVDIAVKIIPLILKMIAQE